MRKYYRATLYFSSHSITNSRVFFLLYVYTDKFLPSGIVVNELKDKKRTWEGKDVAAEEEDEEEEKTIHSLFVAR